MTSKKAPAKKATKRAGKSAATRSKGGRPSKYSQGLLDSICARLAQGEPLAAICRDEGMPNPSTVWDWQQGMPDVSQAIARAREAGEDWLAAECLQIADTPAEGVIEKLEPNKDGKLVVVERRKEDMLGHRKLQIETRLKLLAKWNPKKYGDKVSMEHAGPGGSPIAMITGTMTPAEAAAAYAATVNHGEG